MGAAGTVKKQKRPIYFIINGIKIGFVAQQVRRSFIIHLRLKGFSGSAGGLRYNGI